MAMPVANTWLSWSLLRLLHVEATLSAALFLLAAAVLGLVLGIWVRAIPSIPTSSNQQVAGLPPVMRGTSQLSRVQAPNVV